MRERLKVAPEDRTPRVAVRRPIEAERADRQVRVDRVYARPEHTVTLSALQQRGKDTDYDGVVARDRGSAGGMTDIKDIARRQLAGHSRC
jgi:hypothetical protein